MHWPSIFSEHKELLFPSSSFVGNIHPSIIDSSIELSATGDFIVNGLHTFEIGGKNKGFKQIRGIENSYVVADDIEVGFQKKIPLWLFGFLY